jgi:hypothetical protein
MPLRRVLKWNADRGKFLSAFWATGEEFRVEATLQPWELYAAWIELQINEAVLHWGKGNNWKTLGRLQGDPPDRFYDWVGNSELIPAHVNGPFVPDARLLLVPKEGHRIHRVWVQAEWEQPREIIERRAFLSLQVLNLKCEELVVVTPHLDEFRAMGTESTGRFVLDDKPLSIRVLPFIPDPAAKEANEASIRLLLQAKGKP